VHDRSQRRHSHGAVSVHLGSYTASAIWHAWRAIEAQNRADDVACEGRHPNHDSRRVVVLFDLYPLTFGRRRITTEARILRSDVAGGVHVRSQCRHRRGAVSVHLRARHFVGHGARWERSKFRTEPATSHARAVTRTTTVATRLSSSTCTGSLSVAFGWRPRRGYFAATLQEECTFGLSVVTAAVHSRFHLGTYTASATWRAGERSKLRTEPTTSHARAVMDRSRSAYLHDNGMGSHPRRYPCRTYDGTHAVPTTVPMPYLRRNSPRDSFVAVYFLATNRPLRGYGPGAKRRAKLL